MGPACRHNNKPQFEGDKTQVGVQTSVFELDMFSILLSFGIRTNRTLTKFKRVNHYVSRFKI